MTRTWQISDVTDAAVARVAAARLATAFGVPPVERARLTASLGAQLRLCLTKGGTWRLALETGTVSRPAPQAAERVLHAVVTPSPEAAAAGQPPWRVTVPCPEADDVGAIADAGAVADDPVELAQALLGADEDTALVLERLTEQEGLVDFHREELQQTNQGVVALHAELDAAGRAQREAFAAERKARTEAEHARRRLTFLADASAVLTASLDHHEIVRRLPELLVPEYATGVDIWLFDQDGDRPGCPASTTSRPRHWLRTGPCCAFRCRRGRLRWAW